MQLKGGPDVGVDPGTAMADELLERLADVDPDVEPDLDRDVTPDVRVKSIAACLVAPDGSSLDIADGATVWIGRGPAAGPSEQAVVIAHPLVSRRHLVVRSVAGHLVADDLGSRNGTTVRRANQTISLGTGLHLQPGDLVTTGDGTPLVTVALAAISG